jgi:hypothetical protein
VRLLENASSQNAPTNPLTGQLWWNSQTNTLNAYQGSGVWKTMVTGTSGAVASTTAAAGDLWWNTSTFNLSVYNGTQWINIGGGLSANSNVSVTTATYGIVSNLVTDSSSISHSVGNVVVNNKLSAVISTENASFTPVPSINGLTVINPGLNMITGITSPVYNGGNLTVSNATIASAEIANLVVSGNFSLSSTPTLFANIQTSLTPAANLTYNLGSITNWWNNIYGTSIHAQYADLAERFESDLEYEAGTVVELGGAAEITAVTDDLSEEVFGVISTNAAFVMNSRAGDNVTHPPVAVQGRVPVKVIGKVRKGQRLVSAGNGYARAGMKTELTTWNVIGRALEDKDTDTAGVIEAVVKINS